MPASAQAHVGMTWLLDFKNRERQHPTGLGGEVRPKCGAAVAQEGD